MRKPIETLAIYVSEGHNFRGHHGGVPGTHPIIECESAELVAGKGIVGDRYFGFKEDYKAQVTFFDQAVHNEVCREFGAELLPLGYRRNVLLSGVDLNTLIGKGDIKDDAQGTKEVIRRLKAVAPKAEKAGVVLGLETWLDMREHLHIIDAVGSPNVQVYYDLGNSDHRGYNIYKEIRALGNDRICEIHAKDYAGKLFGQGKVDFWEARRALDDIGYRGWIHIEGRTPFGMRDSYRHDAHFLRAVFPPDT